ncbi:replicative DNA helicase [Brachyspira catarrhinii]|uniref:Replicative DNA helicase n=1 Tax=Brachyspira catarrhinii TaxID=2528966 RepID=A0ABY2TQB5_9SPIR|nr:replicative DNA helicase [Brachyspira catarrhinii]TKZ35076.1 replicative DNA helicase [Brachyspira catarrhinii]
MNNMPYSIEAEESLLGAMLQNPQAISIALSKINSKDFYSERNRLLYESVIEMHNRNIEVNGETALRYLKENGLFEKLFQNDEAYLMRIIDGTPFYQNAKYYSEIIAEKSLLRDLILASQDIQKSAYEAKDSETKEVADFAEKKIFEVTQRRLDNDFIHIRDLLYEALTSIEERKKHKSAVTGVPSGFAGLDRVTHGFQPSDLIILAARPSVGKTSFALNIVEHVMTNVETMSFGIGFFSLEMSRMQLVERLISSKARINLSRVRSGDLERTEWTKLGQTFNSLSQSNLLIDDSSQLTIMEIRGKARQMKYKFAEMSKTSGKNIDLKLIVVDYLQLIHSNIQTRRNGTREQEIADISRGLKALAKELNIPVVALAQLSRAVEQRQDKPRLSDLRESGSIEQDADLVMFLHRQKPNRDDEEVIDERNNQVEVILAKHRNGSIIDGLPLNFVAEQTRFENIYSNADNN